MSLAATQADSGTGHDRAVREIEQRVLWLATSIVDHANRVRPNPSGLKVGGHQSSSASMVTIMTSLWLEQLGAEDRVSVKPHASPVLHALEYLLGQLDASWLTTLRQFGGLQSYPSRLKDPVPADYSTGSVGIGATAPIWGALARRYVNTQFGSGGTRPPGALVGDAELDEGAVWEAVLDPLVAELGEVVWVVDFNRQSLDRVVPTMGADRLQGMFAAAGWQVLTVKYGGLLEELFARPGGAALRDRIDEMSNAGDQRMLRRDPAELRRLLPGEGSGAAAVADLIADVPDADLTAAVRNLGGHDLGALRDAYSRIDDTRPTVIIAYTLKGYELASEGHPQNHSVLLTEAQLHELAARLGVDPDEPWAGFPTDSAPGRLLAEAAQRLRRRAHEIPVPPPVPSDLGRTPSGTGTTQAALGRTLLDLNRAAPEVGRRVVTVSPDVSSSTNLGGWGNKVGGWRCPGTSAPARPGGGGGKGWGGGRRRPAATGSPTIRRPSCTGASAPAASTSSWASPRPTSSARSASWGPPGAGGVSRSCRSASCTTRSWNGRWSHGRSRSTQAGSRSWSARLRASPWPRRAVRTSRSRRRRSDWNSPAASATSRLSRSTPSGACSPRWRKWADRAAAPRTCGCPRVQWTRLSRQFLPTPQHGSFAVGRLSPAPIRCGGQLSRPSLWSRWAQ